MVTHYMLTLQRLIFETTAHLGPLASAVCAGFAVIIFGEVFITPAGEQYLATLETDQ